MSEVPLYVLQNPRKWQKTKWELTYGTPCIFTAIYSEHLAWIRSVRTKDQKPTKGNNTNWDMWVCEDFIFGLSSLFWGLFLQISPDFLQKIRIIHFLAPPIFFSLVNNSEKLCQKVWTIFCPFSSFRGSVLDTLHLNTWVLHQCQLVPRRAPPKTHCLHVLPLWMKGKTQGLPMFARPADLPRLGATVTHVSTTVPMHGIIFLEWDKDKDAMA